MKKIRFWQKHTGKSTIYEGLLVKETETKFIIKVGKYHIEYHYPKASHEFEIVEEK